MTKICKTGLVVGKFCPLHKGHELVINTALNHCERVIILSYTSENYGFSAEVRHYWLRKIFPMADILVLQPEDVPNDDASDIAHREFCANVLEASGLPLPDAVFSSENYGNGFAEHLSIRFHKQVLSIMVDSARVQVPISGTKLRDSPKLMNEFCSNIVWQRHVPKRILFIGSESSGKSTIAERYASYSGGGYVPEFGRTMWELKHGNLTVDDFTFIGKMQIEYEEQAWGMHNALMCDTSPLVTAFYSNKLLGFIPKELQLLINRKYDYTFFCENDFGYIDDGTRNGVEFGLEQRQFYKFYMEHLSQGWISLGGTILERIDTIQKIVDPHLYNLRNNT